MKVAIATDHNGVKEKQALINALKDYEIIDMSTDNTPIDDYPDFAFRVANTVLKKEANLGILMCGTGIGMSIAANKVKGIRCAHCSNVEQAHLAREHNDANIIALSYKQEIDELIDMIKEFIKTPHSEDERHHRRINKIINYEEGTYNEL